MAVRPLSSACTPTIYNHSIISDSSHLRISVLVAPSKGSPAASSAVSGTTVSGVKASGTVAVYSALNDSTNNAFVDAFKKANPGVNVSLVPIAAAGELQTRIQTEKASPKADVFIGGSSEFHDPLGKAGLLEAYKPAGAADIDAGYKDANGFWTGWYLGIFGFVYNTDR